MLLWHLNSIQRKVFITSEITIKDTKGNKLNNELIRIEYFLLHFVFKHLKLHPDALLKESL